MPLYPGIDGANRKIKKLFTGIDGAKKELKELWADQNGAKRKIFFSGIQLGGLPVGSIVKLKENGVAKNYIVVHQGLPSSLYDSSCNGTWLLRQNLIENRVWNSSNVNALENSEIQRWLNGTMLGKYDANIQAAIKQVKIPYCVGGGSSQVNSGANGLSCKLFLLGCYELGWTTSDYRYFPVDGAKLSYFESGFETSASNKRIAKLDATGKPFLWWLRSPETASDEHVFLITISGNIEPEFAKNGFGIRPANVMPPTLLIDDNMNIIA